MSPTNQSYIIEEIVEERLRQDTEWGFPRESMTNLSHAMMILSDVYGEACKALVTHLTCPKHLESKRIGLYFDLRKELVRTAAVAVSIIEHMDGKHIAEGKNHERDAGEK